MLVGPSSAIQEVTFTGNKNENDPIQVTKMPPKKKKGRSPKKRKMPAWLKKPKSEE